MPKKKQKTRAVNNLVAKHALNYNKSSVFVDRKKEAKRGKKIKHQGRLISDPFYFRCSCL